MEFDLKFVNSPLKNILLQEDSTFYPLEVEYEDEDEEEEEEEEEEDEEEGQEFHINEHAVKNLYLIKNKRRK